ncbi:transcription factor bHLH104-like [Punica granatum]|uniref:Transcription factor bHLH104-like n=1 Tax=Punica granatum TaxID=22663 RepID=A0A218XLG2_PUNGR|nr:transcription factor bHLH104-like [Punica granatum]OWM85744.1 hypothetical protein CDL15_Pgr023677 [Punica granatum]
MDPMELEDDSCWDFLDCSFFDDGSSPVPPSLWPNSRSAGVSADLSSSGVVPPESECSGRQCTRKRARGEACSRPGTKACREKLRRERLNDRFLDLSAVLEPGRSCKTEKPAILDDAIRVLTQLKSESQELKETNEKLLEEIKCLKVEKNELREEKLTLKADKERMEQQLKTMSIPPTGFVPTHPAAYHHPVVNKMAVYPSYGLIPMWQYMPPSARDTSSDHELRPPAA